jgi:hypothetical protein
MPKHATPAKRPTCPQMIMRQYRDSARWLLAANSRGSWPTAEFGHTIKVEWLRRRSDETKGNLSSLRFARPARLRFSCLAGLGCTGGRKILLLTSGPAPYAAKLFARSKSWLTTKHRIRLLKIYLLWPRASREQKPSRHALEAAAPRLA